MIILASSSPRRSELLRNAAIPFRVKPGHVPESPNPGETPVDYCRRLALDKARAVQAQFQDCFILGADTLRDISLALLTGTLIGTYSTPFVASPLYATFRQGEAAIVKRDRRVRQLRAKSVAA